MVARAMMRDNVCWELAPLVSELESVREALYNYYIIPAVALTAFGHMHEKS